MRKTWPVVDLFSGCGGMSCGFARRAPFELVAAVDAQLGKPSDGANRLDCNGTYHANFGLTPLAVDLLEVQPQALFASVSERTGLKRGELTVLIACPPCTDFSRTKPGNHIRDSRKNSLVTKTADFVAAFWPEFVVMENAREMIRGRNGHHFETLCTRLGAMGYAVHSGIHMLSDFGLPQKRERALLVASRVSAASGLEALWDGWQLRPGTATVRHGLKAYASRPVTAGQRNEKDPAHSAPGFAAPTTLARLRAIPADGGSWVDLLRHPRGSELMIDSMKRRVARGDLGSHPDVYGRMAWDRPAPTIKRECAHIGNGRYAHPVQHRLLTVREMSLLQGFPRDFRFSSRSLTKSYKHIGDAVPPMISYQLSALVAWLKTGERPGPGDWVLPGTSLTEDDIQPAHQRVDAAA
jgi:DNA (cytosine-5)-methyltransferase 1